VKARGASILLSPFAARGRASKLRGSGRLSATLTPDEPKRERVEIRSLIVAGLPAVMRAPGGSAREKLKPRELDHPRKSAARERARKA
jgi:hypothetical protein